MLTTYTNEDRDAKGAVTLCLASFPVRDSNPGLLRATHTAYRATRFQVHPGFEPGLPESESGVLTN